MKVIYLTGLSGAGKSTVTDFLEEQNIPVFYSGSVIKQDLNKNDKLSFGNKYNTSTGFIEDVVDKALKKYKDSNILIFDSIRSLDEYYYVNSLPNESYLAAIICNKNQRYERIKSRDNGIQLAKIRDLREIGITEKKFNVGALIAMADYYINNSDNLDYTHKQINNMLEGILWK